MRTRHLKTRIALSLMLFIGLGMILIDLVLGLMTHRQMVKAEIVRARTTLAAITRHIQSPPLLSASTINYVHDLAEVTGLSVVMVDVKKNLVFQSKMDAEIAEKLARFTRTQIFRDGVAQQFYGSYFGVLGPQYNHLFIGQALRTPQGESLGAVGVNIPLCTFMQRIMDGQPLVWAYILFNLLVLTGLAYWRFSHFLIVPLQQVAEKAASYQDDGFQLSSDLQTDDVSKLSRSLDQMFKRIHNDRDELQKMVITLEEVNSSLTKAQADIIRAEKMASVGRLSAGIAHEIGNPLGIVLGYLDLLRGDDLSAEDRLEFTTRAMAEIQRISTIIRQLLDFSRPATEGAKQCSVHDLLHSFADDLALQAVVGEMELSFSLGAKDDVVGLDPEKLRQVFLNLLLNGADAVREVAKRGKMKIVTASITDETTSLPQIEIRFIDNGPGIDPGHLKQIFDPFFTTKEVGHGTGLGLSVSYMIIDNSGGTIQALAAEAGCGTEFRIILPLQSA